MFLMNIYFYFSGRVYNVTHYMEYHPGGLDELMKGAGKDATELFDQVLFFFFSFLYGTAT